LDPNYTVSTFSRATAPTDLFKATDVQGLAAAVSTHTHGTGLGLPLAAGAIAAGSITSAMIADGAIATADLADGAITSAKLAANIAIAGTLSVGGASTFTGIVNASSILMTPTGVIRMGPAAAQQSGGLNLANSNPVSWRNVANTADISMIINDQNDLSRWGSAATACLPDGQFLRRRAAVALNGIPIASR
jgi:hypothetical protein